MADIEEIKAQCPFCKIVSGEYPSQKIFEDDKILAVMDINPANKGSVLVLTKEHYPFLQALPPDVFDHVAKMIRELSIKISDAMLTPGCELVISSGAAAGQPLFHFSFYLMPREGGDGLSQFSIESKELDKTAVDGLKSVLASNLKISYGRNFGGKTEVPEMTKERVLEIINSNSQIKEMILNNTEEFKKAIPINPQLQALFKNVTVDEIVEELKLEKKEDVQTQAASEVVEKEEDVQVVDTDVDADTDDEEKTEESDGEKDDDEGDIDVDYIAELFS